MDPDLMSKNNRKSDGQQPIERVLPLLQGVKAKADGSQWSALCPAHDDHEPSLSVGVGDDGRVLLHCHRGCQLSAILTALQLEASDLFSSNGSLPTYHASNGSTGAPKAKGLSILERAKAHARDIGPRHKEKLAEIL